MFAAWAEVHLLLDQGADREGEDPGGGHRGLWVVQGGVHPGARAAGLPPCRRRQGGALSDEAS